MKGSIRRGRFARRCRAAVLVATLGAVAAGCGAAPGSAPKVTYPPATPRVSHHPAVVGRQAESGVRFSCAVPAALPKGSGYSLEVQNLSGHGIIVTGWVVAMLHDGNQTASVDDPRGTVDQVLANDEQRTWTETDFQGTIYSSESCQVLQGYWYTLKAPVTAPKPTTREPNRFAAATGSWSSCASRWVSNIHVDSVV